MGYEIAGAVGVKMAAPDREVFSLVGDGSYLMLSSELVTAVQEGIKIVVVLVDNHGYASIGGLSRSVGLEGFGTQHRMRRAGTLGLDGEKDPPPLLPIDLVANAASLGAATVRAKSIGELRDALASAKRAERTTVIVVEVDRYASVPSYETWWDVAIAERSEVPAVREARERYVEAKRKQRRYLG
jgi:3D-(3,5/4)-trihydroxycyclohexane-1,2-dione acylhydrolase (decyclizing)